LNLILKNQFSEYSASTIITLIEKDKENSQVVQPVTEMRFILSHTLLMVCEMFFIKKQTV